MSAYGSGKASDTDFRRTWNKEEYAAKAKAREERDRIAEKNDERRKMGLPPLKSNRKERDEPKELLTYREKAIDVEKNVGKIQVVQNAESRKQPGFYCEACDITIKDSVTWLDHLNGRKHLANVGVSTKVERADVNAVKERLAMLTQKRKNPEADKYDLDERIQALKQKEEEDKQRRREKKKQKKEEKKKSNKEEPEQGDDEMAKMMGFSGFGSSKA